jgi:hypothetical protein
VPVSAALRIRPYSVASWVADTPWAPSSGDKDRNPRWYADRGIAEYWLAEPIEGDTWGALITQYQLARTPAGTAAYVETGRTTLAALEADPTA